MKYNCEVCLYATKYKSHFSDHLESKKHLKNIEVYNKLKSDFSRVQYEKSRVQYGKSDDVCDCSDVGIQNQPSSANPNDKLEDMTDKVVKEKIKSYLCNRCGISLANRSNQLKHMRKCSIVKSVLGENNDLESIKNNICPLCNVEFSRKQILVRHMNLCSNQLNKSKIEMLEIKLKHSEEIKQIYAEQAKNSNTLAVGNMCNVNGLIQTNNDLVETNMRTITFLNKFMHDAPCLEHFNKEFKDPYIFYIDYAEHKKIKEEGKVENTKDNILYYDEEKMTKDEFIIDHILFLQKSKQTVKFLVERLLHFYKKEGDTKQSIWNIDMYRYNFTICLKTGNKTLWHSDKQGQTTTEMILDPLLNFTSKIIEKHLEVLQLQMQEFAKQMKTNEMLGLLKKVEHLTDFTMSVNKKELQQEIIRKISPLLSFDVTKHKELLLEDN
jgi:hypothetical protein